MNVIESMHEVALCDWYLHFWRESVIYVEDDTLILVRPSDHELVASLGGQGDAIATVRVHEGSGVRAALLGFVYDDLDHGAIITFDLNLTFFDLVSPSRIGRLNRLHLIYCLHVKLTAL